MKKIVSFLGAAAILAGITSCGGSSKAPTNFEDSLMVYSGEYSGWDLLNGYNTLPEEQKAKLPKDEILRGIRDMVLADTNQQAYVTGLQIGMRAYGQLMSYEQAGIKVDRKAFYNAYEKAFREDSVNQEKMTVLGGIMQELGQKAQVIMNSFYEQKQQEAKAAKENSPEAKKGLAEGKKYIDAQMKKDPSLVKTPSGLVYKVVNPGEGPAVGTKGSAKVKYKGMLIDGTVFDQNAEGIDMFPGGVIPGFGEGLAMLKKGAKYILYIPGDLAYGPDGTPDGKITPNATLVFEVEAVEVQPGE